MTPLIELSNPLNEDHVRGSDWDPQQMNHEVSDAEGTLLSLVERAQPVTVYEISKIYRDSPVTHFGTSKGKLYPMVRRLKELGLLKAQAQEGDKRKTEHLRCTKEGVAALRHWVGRIDQAHALLDDPLRTRIQSLHLLSTQEQIEWLEGVADAMRAKLQEVEDYVANVELPRVEIVLDHVRTTSSARLEWIERTIRFLVDHHKDIETD